MNIILLDMFHSPVKVQKYLFALLGIVKFKDGMISTVIKEVSLFFFY